MAVTFTRWTLLRIFELGLCISCLICKRVTDDEASRLFLLLQKLSREWSLLNNITWDKIGAAVADATYGGYIIITAGLLLGNIFGELPTHRRITEMFLIGCGALLFIVLGALEFAALDSVPPELVDNAAILGTLSLVTAGLFLLDLGGPRAKKAVSHQQPAPTRNGHPKHQEHQRHISKPTSYETEVERRHVEPRSVSRSDRPPVDHHKHNKSQHSHVHHHPKQNGHAHTPKNEPKDPNITFKTGNGYHQMQEKQRPRRFDIYGKDMDDEVFEDDNQTSAEDADKHSPVWSKIRKGEYGKYDNITPSFLLPRPELEEKQPPMPSSPGDPGYVQYTAKRWGQQSQKTPRHSPTPV